MLTVEPGLAVTLPIPVPAANVTVPTPVPLLSARRFSPPPAGTLMLALTTPSLTAMLRKADSVSVVGAAQAMLAKTEMSPAWAPGLPAPPVVTVTLAAFNAVCSVALLITLSFAPGVNVPPAFVAPASAPVVMKTLKGSSSRVPYRPFAAERSARPS